MFACLTHRWFHCIALLVLLLALIFYSFSETPWRKDMQYMVFDAFNQKTPRAASGEVLILDIDDDSLHVLGQWPWPRTILAEIITNLTAMGAKVIAFDGVLAEPDNASPDLIAARLPKEPRFDELRETLKTLENHDDILARAIRESGRFVSAFTYGSYAQMARKPQIKKQILLKQKDRQQFLNHSASFGVAATFLPQLESAAAGNGSFMATPDHDGVIRRTGLLFSDGQDLYPSLALEAFRVGSGHQKAAYKVGATPHAGRHDIDTDYRIILGNSIIPIEDDGKMLLYYRAFDEKGKDYLSAYKVLDPTTYDAAAAQVKDKYIFIGASAEGLKDLRSTALEPFQPGVEIHAGALEQILQKTFLLRPHEIVWVEANFLLISGLLIIFLAPFVPVAALGILCAGVIGGALWGANWAYIEHGLLLDPFYSSLCIFVLFVLSVMLSYLRTASEKAQVRTAFGHYISPDFMRELTKNPDKLKLGGENRELTVLFSDIRSFTSISEGLTPQDLIQLMNDFLTPMSDLVMKHRGTIDKYMGDAMMAFWNAPLDDPDHARHACLAALKMQDALEPINDNIKNRAGERGEEPILLKAGIGINTGACAVGNMGSRQRFAYSALGDAVNLASRLEGQTKAYGVGILIGEETQSQVSDFATLELDLLQVQGKQEAVCVFALLGDEELAQKPEFKSLKAGHDKMIALYRAAKFKEAQALTSLCLEKQKVLGLDLDEFYQLYEERLALLIASPPKGKWNGVFVATGK